MRKNYPCKPIIIGVLSYLIILISSGYALSQTAVMQFKDPTNTTIASGGSYDFGSTSIGIGTGSITFGVRSSILGTGPLNLSGVPTISISGANAADFVINSYPSASIANGTTSNFTITFNPATAGAKVAQISIANDGTGANPYIINFTGTGIAPSMNLTQGATNLTNGSSTYNFGSIAVNSSIGPTTFTIGNAGAGSLSLTGSPFVNISGANASDYSIVQTGITTPVAFSGSTTFTITFTPTGAGARTAQISIASNDPTQNPYTVNLTGTGIGSVISITAPVKKDFCLNTAANLGSIVLTEVTGNELSVGTNYMFITAPAGFNFVTSSGAISFSPAKDITAASFLFQSTSVFAVSYTVTGTAKNDVLTISGVQLKSSSLTGNVDLLFGSGSSPITGLTPGTSVLGTVATALSSISLAPVTPKCSNVGPTTLNGSYTLSTGTGAATFSSNAYTSVPTAGAITGGNIFRPVNVGTNGTQTVTYTVNTSGGCAFTTTTSIDVNAAPTVTLVIDETSGNSNNDNMICAGDAITLIGSGAGTNSYFFIKNSAYGAPIGGPVSSMNYPSSSFSSGNTFSVIGTDANGCSDTSGTTAVTLYPKPAVTWTPTSTSFGQGAPPNNLNANGTHSPNGGVFSGSGVYYDFIATNYKFNPGIASLGGNTVVYTVTDANGCSNFATAILTVASGSVDILGWGNNCWSTSPINIDWPTASVTTPGNPVYFLIYDYSTFSYNLVPTSVVGPNYQTSIITANLTYTNLYATSSTIYVYEYDASLGYNFLGYESATINPPPTVSINNNFFSPIYYHCPNETPLLLNTTPSATTASSVFTYSSASPGFVYSPSTDVFKVDWSKAYNYPLNNSITFTYTDPLTTCSNSATIVGITVDPAGAVPTVVTPANPYCSGTSITNLTANKQAGFITNWYSVTIPGGVETLIYTDYANQFSATTLYSPGVLTNGTNNQMTYRYHVKQSNTYQTCYSNSSADLDVLINPAIKVSAGSNPIYVCGDTSRINVLGIDTIPTMYGAVATTWTTSGDGFFTPANNLLTRYTPGTNDKALGSATLTLTSADPDGNPLVACPAVASSTLLSISKPATVNAGGPYNFCASQTNTALSASISSNVTATWNGINAANLNSITSLNPVYNATGIQKNGGAYNNVSATRAPSIIKIALTTTDPDGVGPCLAVTDTATINIYPQLTVNAGPDISVCAGSTINLNGSVLLGDVSRTKTGLPSVNNWNKVVALGSISPNPVDNFTGTYNPSGAIAANTGELGNGGTITLVFASGDPDGVAGPCLADSDYVNITIYQRARVSAGVDTVYCATDIMKLNGSLLTNAVTSITWSGKPVGDFSDATVRNPILTSSTPSDYYGGVYDPITGTSPPVNFVLTLTGNDPVGPCPAESDNVQVSINPAVSVNAGSDYSVCGHKLIPTAFKTLVSGADVKIGKITDRLTSAAVNNWSVLSGAGALSGINFSSNFNVNYKPSGVLADSGTVISNGSGEFGNLSLIMLMLKSNDPDGAGPCKADSDFVNITLYPRPITHFSGFATEYCRNTPFVVPIGNIDYRLLNGAVFSGTGISTFGNGFKFDPGDPTIPAKGATFPIRYKQTDANTCYNFVDTIVKVFPVPVVSFTTSSRCQFDTVKFKSTSSVLTTQFPGSMKDWNWAIDGDTLQHILPYTIASGKSLHVDSTKYSFLNYGIHSIHLDVASNSGGNLNCYNHKDTTMIFGPYPNTNFTWSRPCLGDTVFFVNNTTIAPGYSNSTFWNMHDLSNNTNYVLSKDTSTNPKFKFNKQGIYNVQLIDTTKTYNCISIKTKEVFIVPTYSITPSHPYDSSFATGTRDWAPNGFQDQPYSWQHGTPTAAKHEIKPGGGIPAWSGNNVWITNTSGDYKIGELSYLNSPCFNFSTLDKPMLVMKNWISSTNLAGTVLEATTGNGNPWLTIGQIGSAGVFWYNTPGVVGLIGTNGTNPLAQGFSGEDTTFRLSRIGLSQYANANKLVRFRIAFGSANVNDPLNKRDGFALDSVWIGNRSKVVLMEHFTNSADATSKIADDTVNTIQAQRVGDVISVHYHYVPPLYPADNMYLKNPADPSSRVLYYGISGVPITEVDGQQSYSKYLGNVPGSITKNVIDNKALEDALFSVDISSAMTGTIDSVKLDIKTLMIAKAPLNQGVVLQVAVLESVVSGAGGLSSTYQWVLKKMLPDAAGSYISKNWSSNDSLAIPLKGLFSLTDFYDTSKIQIVAFVQNYLTKEVYQAAKVGAHGSTGAVIPTPILNVQAEGDLMVYPVPADNEINILFSTDMKEDADYSLMSDLGVTVASGKISKGVRMVTFNSKQYASGVYHLAIVKEDGSRINKKVMVIH